MATKKLIGFYHPHMPVRYTGELVNHYTGEVFTPPARTKQEFKKECDINNIVSQFKVTGMISHVNAQRAQGQYLNLPDELDYQASLNLVRRAGEAFASLPSKVRDRFKNDPTAFLAFMSDPKNLEEAQELGLVEKPRAPQPGPAPEPVPAPTPTPEPPKA